MDQINEGLKAKYDEFNASAKPIDDWSVDGQRAQWFVDNVKKLDDLDKGMSAGLAATLGLIGTGRITGKDSGNISKLRHALTADLLSTIAKGATSEAGYVNALKKVKKIVDSDKKNLNGDLGGIFAPLVLQDELARGGYKTDEINLIIGGLYLIGLKGFEANTEGDKEAQYLLQHMQGGAAISAGYKTIASVNGKVKQFLTAARDALKSKFVIAEECTQGSFEAALNYILIESARRPRR